VSGPPLPCWALDVDPIGVTGGSGPETGAASTRTDASEPKGDGAAWGAFEWGVAMRWGSQAGGRWARRTVGYLHFKTVKQYLEGIQSARSVCFVLMFASVLAP